MTHRFLFRTEHGEVVEMTVMPDAIAKLPSMSRSAILWNMDRQMEFQMPPMPMSQVIRYNSWTTEVLACAVSKVKRRLYAKAKK
jgi:hypothetical protein